MALSKGIIVEHGGILSHASIVARELGIPAVIGITGACEKFKTGDILFVDGEKGFVSKVKE
jgi:pyruvate,water dikinase